jgi:glycosyltransferase involved in cell wall biosynthesis
LNPKLSVVIASVNGGKSLADCIASLEPQKHGDDIEIVVCESFDDAVAKDTHSQFPNVRFFHFSERKSIPELRVTGILNARGDVIALTEDHCIVHEHWVASVLSAHTSPYLVIGGAVENVATERLIDWAVFFCEYGRYMIPIASGAIKDLPGPNVSYKRAVLENFRDVFATAAWEPFWHSRLMDAGVTLFSDPRLIVYHRKNFTLGGFLRERFHYARSFAGERVKDAPWIYRAMYICGSPFLSPLLLSRIVVAVWRKHRKQRELILSLPYIFLFTLAWSLGEFIGYAAGQGNSLGKVE